MTLKREDWSRSYDLATTLKVSIYDMSVSLAEPFTRKQKGALSLSDLGTVRLRGLFLDLNYWMRVRNTLKNSFSLLKYVKLAEEHERQWPYIRHQSSAGNIRPHKKHNSTSHQESIWVRWSSHSLLSYVLLDRQTAGKGFILQKWDLINDWIVLLWFVSIAFLPYRRSLVS